MSLSDQDRDPEMAQLIQAVLRAFEQNNFPAIAVLPSDDVSVSRTALEQLCQLNIASGPGRRRN